MRGVKWVDRSETTHSDDTMKQDAHPITYFNRWLSEPIAVGSDANARAVVDALNFHPMVKDERTQDYVMPPNRYNESPGKFRIFGENQDTFYCFLRAGDEVEVDPPVYFESCLDLKMDYGLSDSQIIDGNHIEVCPEFTNFIWHMIAHLICIRLEFGPALRADVNGLVFDGEVHLRGEFMNPMGSQFPAGNTCFVSEDAICCPDWGAAFLNEEVRAAFLARYSPKYSKEWSSQLSAELKE